jgi:hypothetical protein
MNLHGIVNVSSRVPVAVNRPQGNEMVVFFDGAIRRLPVNAEIGSVRVSFVQFLLDKLPDDDPQRVFIGVYHFRSGLS